MTCGIYKLTSPSGRIYIGCSKNIERRWIEHKSCSLKKHPKLYYSIRKYGFDKFKKEIIEICIPEQLGQKEIYYINLYNTFHNGLNSTTGGEGGYIRSDETKNKIRKSLLGKYYGSQNEKFYINNTLYTSISDASKKTNIPPKTIYNRLNSTNEKYKNYIYCNPNLIPIRKPNKNHNAKPCFVNGKCFSSLTEASKINNIKIATLGRYLKNPLKFKQYHYI